MGKSFFYDDKAADAVRAAGFTGVSERRVKVPIGTWPKDKKLKQWGLWNRQFVLQGIEGFSIRGLTEMLGVSFSRPDEKGGACANGGIVGVR